VTRYDHRIRLLAACLSSLAGYVDAIGFLHLGGFFISFMSGNSTRMGVGIVDNGHHAMVAAALVGSFLLGVTAGSLIGRRLQGQRHAGMLVLVAALLASAAGLGGLGMGRTAVFFMALAMGAENCVFEHDGEVRIGLTYMTGNLVKLGQRLAGAITGGPRLGWLPYLLLWLGLAAGAAAGAAAYPLLGLSALWVAASACLLFAGLSRQLDFAGQSAPRA